MITDSFFGDLKYFERLLSSFTPFSLTRFGDGEQTIINNVNIDLLHKEEFSYNGEPHLRNALKESFQLDKPRYYIGIACACCAGNEVFLEMVKDTLLPEDRLTWANVFVNSNYKYFKDNFPKLFSKYKTTYIAPGSPAKLPFPIDFFHKVGPNAWIQNNSLQERLYNHIKENEVQGELFLFSAGPYANILCSFLYREFPKNTYIDLGSVFNVELGIGANRKYLQGKKTINKTCAWGIVNPTKECSLFDKFKTLLCLNRRKRPFITNCNRFG
jgi:hypothetical protein